MVTANVLATTNKIETQLETNSEAQVGQFRVIKKHMEVYNGTRGKFYKMYVLASVPKNEVGRVKAWQKENDLQKIAKLKSLNNQQFNLIQETKMELENVQNELESALEIIKQKDFLEKEVSDLRLIKEQYEVQKEEHAKALIKIKTLSDIIRYNENVIDSLKIDIKLAKENSNHWETAYNNKKTFSLFESKK